MPGDWGPPRAQELWEHAGLGPGSHQAEQTSTGPPSLSLLCLPAQGSRGRRFGGTSVPPRPVFWALQGREMSGEEEVHFTEARRLTDIPI